MKSELRSRIEEALIIALDSSIPSSLWILNNQKSPKIIAKVIFREFREIWESLRENRKENEYFFVWVMNLI